MDKRDFFEHRLRSGSAFLHLDGRRPGVLVPGAFTEEPHLVLQYGYDLARPIPDLAISDWGVRATLSFHQQPFLTAVPWSAVFAVHGDDTQVYVWHEDMPSDLDQVDQGALRASPRSEERPPPKRAKGHLKLVP